MSYLLLFFLVRFMQKLSCLSNLWFLFINGHIHSCTDSPPPINKALFLVFFAYFWYSPLFSSTLTEILFVFSCVILGQFFYMWLLHFYAFIHLPIFQLIHLVSSTSTVAFILIFLEQVLFLFFVFLG